MAECHLSFCAEQFDTSLEITFDLRDYDVEAKELQAKGEWEGDGDDVDRGDEYSHPPAPSIASQHLAHNSLSLHSTGLGPAFTHRSSNLATGEHRFEPTSCPQLTQPSKHRP